MSHPYGYGIVTELSVQLRELYRQIMRKTL